MVFEATDLSLSRSVAVKVLRPELATAAESARFLREARTLANLSHPNVVPVHEVGQGEGLYFFIMDRVNGETLAARLTRGPLGAEEARRVGLELLDALGMAHGASIVHRDVKPANIFLAGGRPLLADFGIAHSGEGEGDPLTREGEWRGTPQYMAPEVLRGSQATPRSDLYSLGAVLYESVTGRPWEDGEHGRWGGVPARMIPALRGALTADPRDRFADAESFHAVLDRPSGVRAVRWRRVLPLAAAGLAAISIAVWKLGPGGPSEPVTVLVAPIADLSPDGSLAQIADGLTDAVTTVVGTAPSVQPVGRFTAATLRGRNTGVATLRDEYSVAYVVEGAVRGNPDEVRVSAVLTDAATGLERWSRSFTFAGDEVLLRQDDVGWAVLRAIEQEIGGDETPRVSRSTTRDIQAFDAYRTARQAWMVRNPVGLLEVALPGFQRAVDLDPEWALAWAGLADVYNIVGAYEYGLLAPTVAFGRARRASARALELAPGLPEAMTARASVLWNADRDVAGAERLFRAAIAANRSYAPALQWYSILLAATGRHEEALTNVLEAYQADVLSPVISTELARQYYYARQFHEASERFRQALELDSAYLATRLGFGMSLIQEGELDLALAQFERGRDLTGGTHAAPLSLIGYVKAKTGHPDEARAILADIRASRAAGTYVPFEYDAVVLMGLDQHDEAVSALSQALAVGSNGPMIFHTDPFLDPLHGHPGFEALLDEIGVRRPAP